MAITTNLCTIFTRAREMTVTDAELHIITKKPHLIISSTTSLLLKNRAPHIASNTVFIISVSLLEIDELILTVQVK